MKSDAELPVVLFTPKPMPSELRAGELQAGRDLEHCLIVEAIRDRHRKPPKAEDRVPWSSIVIWKEK